MGIQIKGKDLIEFSYGDNQQYVLGVNNSDAENRDVKIINTDTLRDDFYSKIMNIVKITESTSSVVVNFNDVYKVITYDIVSNIVTSFRVNFDPNKLGTYGVFIKISSNKSVSVNVGGSLKTLKSGDYDFFKVKVSNN